MYDGDNGFNCQCQHRLLALVEGVYTCRKRSPGAGFWYRLRRKLLLGFPRRLVRICSIVAIRGGSCCALPQSSAASVSQPVGGDPPGPPAASLIRLPMRKRALVPTNAGQGPWHLDKRRLRPSSRPVTVTRPPTGAATSSRPSWTWKGCPSTMLHLGR